MKKIEYSKKVGTIRERAVTTLGVVLFSGVMFVAGVANADALKASVDTKVIGTPVKTTVSVNTTRLQNIISKGDQEIERRLTTLNTLTSKINAATKLTASDKTTLSNEVSTTISGLTSLKTQLDASTTVTVAVGNAQDIYTEYRVYALVAPKIDLIKVADDQQAVEAKLTALAQKLQTRIAAEQQAGKNVTTLQSELTDMNAKIAASQAISLNIESTVINLEPSDYNSNHAVLSGDNTQLKTAHNDNAAADTDAKNIVAALKSL